MNQSIHFPHLGIHLQYVGKAVEILGVEIAYYGILIGIGMLAGLLIVMSEVKRTKQNAENYLDLAILGIIFSIIGARIYYVIFSWDYYKKNIPRMFYLREGGMAIYGGVIAAVIVAVIYCAGKKMQTLLVLDTVSMGLAAGQVIGRWGNFFNREAFGEYTNGIFAMQLPEDAVRTADITEALRANMVTVDGIPYIQVHPTFLYESALCLFILLVLLGYRKKKKFDGELFFLYMALYGLGRFFIEELRTDQLQMAVTGYPASQVIAGMMSVFCPILIIYGRMLQSHRNKQK